jgi:xanthine dehydrogenase YagR molybdenum-binding subunit
VLSSVRWVLAVCGCHFRRTDKKPRRCSPPHADVPHLDIVFINEVNATMSPLKAKGVGDLGLTGVAAATANAVYNATGVRVRDYPLTLDKHLSRLPAIT